MRASTPATFVMNATYTCHVLIVPSFCHASATWMSFLFCRASATCSPFWSLIVLTSATTPATSPHECHVLAFFGLSSSWWARYPCHTSASHRRPLIADRWCCSATMPFYLPSPTRFPPSLVVVYFPSPFQPSCPPSFIIWFLFHLVVIFLFYFNMYRWLFRPSSRVLRRFQGVSPSVLRSPTRLVFWVIRCFTAHPFIHLFTYSPTLLYFTLFHFISLYFALFHFISLYFTLLRFIPLYFTLFHFIPLYFTLFHFIFAISWVHLISSDVAC